MTLQTPQRQVFIIGGAGHGNLGDEALLRYAVQFVRRKDPKIGIAVATPDPSVTRRTLGVKFQGLFVSAPRTCLFRIDKGRHYWACDEVFFARYQALLDFFCSNTKATAIARLEQNRGPDFVDGAAAARLLSALERSSLALVHGGGFLTSATRSRLYDFHLLAVVCREWSIPLALRGQQIGPFSCSADKAVAEDIIRQASYIGLRDKEQSIHIVQEFGGTAREFVDDALLTRLPASSLSTRQNCKPAASAIRCLNRLGLQAGNYVAVCARSNASVGMSGEYIKRMAVVCQRIAKKSHKDILLVPLATQDIRTLSEVAALAGTGCTVLPLDGKYWDAVTALENAWLTVSSPHHGLIFSLRGGVPIVSPVQGDYYLFKNKGSLRHYNIDCNVFDLEEPDALGVIENLINQIQSSYTTIKNTILDGNKALRTASLAAESSFWALAPRA
ncbi:hypothetical protein HMPREF9946_00460 [Acetobacteraceae bacterium AT-5844]|nr:hypothetical protein HMPREF9946_00460 [Acetobacteraceae bacterium AT-5844]